MLFGKRKNWVILGKEELSMCLRTGKISRKKGPWCVHEAGGYGCGARKDAEGRVNERSGEE